MSTKLVIIPGTFNPVTCAHVQMGEAVRSYMEKQELHCKIVYVPTKSRFLTDWKHMEDNEIMPDEMRYTMLALALEDTDFELDNCEMTGKSTGKTYDTLTYLSEKYGISPSDTYWVCGSDKPSEIKIWYRPNDILSSFRLIVIQRSNDNVKKIIETDSLLCHFTDRIEILENEECYQTISATQIRNAIDKGNLSSVKELLNPKVYNYLKNME